MKIIGKMENIFSEVAQRPTGGIETCEFISRVERGRACLLRLVARRAMPPFIEKLRNLVQNIRSLRITQIIILFIVIENFTGNILLSRDFSKIDIPSEIRNVHADLMKLRPDIYNDKCNQLRANDFSFYRGTAFLFYNDINKSPQLKFLDSAPVGLVHGDCHLNNFSVLYLRENQFSYMVDDFDEANEAPLSYDLFRLITSMVISFNNHSTKKEQEFALNSCMSGYISGFTESPDKKFTEVILPVVLKKFIEKHKKKKRETFVRKYSTSSNGNIFKPGKFIPLSVEEALIVKKAFLIYLNEIANRKNLPTNFVVIKDIAINETKGIASLGGKRYLVLIEGETSQWEDDHIIEVKEIQPSRTGKNSSEKRPNTILQALKMAHREQDNFLGVMDINSKPFLVRELFPWGSRLVASKIKNQDMGEIARSFGAILANFHSGNRKNVEMKQWVQSNEKKLIESAFLYANQVHSDFESFRHFSRKEEN